MKYTQENITELLRNFGELTSLVDKFCTKPGYSWDDARINYETFTIEKKVNTACNCHPEYEWQYHATIGDFLEWYEKLVTGKSEKA